MNGCRRFFALIVLAIFAAFTIPTDQTGHAVYAQLLPTKNADTAAPPAVDPFGRTTPRSAVEGFLSAVRQDDFDKAARYFDLREIPEEKRRQTGLARAEELIQLLNRDGFVNQITELSSLPTGRLNDQLPANLEQVGVLDRSVRKVPLTMHRVVDKDGLEIWLFEPSVVKRLPFLLQISSEGLLDQILPESLKTSKIGTVSTGHWIGIIVAAFLAFLIGYVISLFIIKLLRAFLKGKQAPTGKGILTSIVIPLAVVIGVVVYRNLVVYLGIQVVARDYISWMATVASWMSVAWLGMRIVDGAAEFVRYGMSRINRATSVAVVMLARRMAKMVVIAIAAINILDIFGVDVTTGLAALGIGGLALALGAQKTIENLVGSITVVADKPVRVGDFCKFGDTMGTVEDIGIRSTQIRTLDRTIVTIPNGAFASMQIENYSSRDEFLFRTTLNLRYETTQAQVNAVLTSIRKLILDHEKISNDPARVRLIALGSHSLDVEIFCYIMASSYEGFLEVQEELLLDVMRIVAAKGAEFAFPSQTMYLGKDGLTVQADNDSPALEVPPSSTKAKRKKPSTRKPT